MFLKQISVLSISFKVDVPTGKVGSKGAPKVQAS